MMLTTRPPPPSIIRVSRPGPGFAGDVLWLAFTAFVAALILVVVGSPLWAELSMHNSPGGAAGEPAAHLIPGASAGSAVVAPFPDSYDRRSDRATLHLTNSADEIDEGSIKIAPPSSITMLGERADDMGDLGASRSLAAGLSNLHPLQRR
jgi:hypothetical protein